jgi:NTP pyrophosphatase (non-canonical NTP hydrolase)
MELKEIQKRALEIRAKYEELEKKKYGRSWTDEEIALGMVGDVGDLLKLVQAKNGIRDIDDVDGKLGHELADCLWCLLVLANKYEVNIEEIFLKTMGELEERIKKEV